MDDDVGPVVRSRIAWTGAAVGIGLAATAVVAVLHRLDTPSHGAGWGQGVAALVVALAAALGLVVLGGARQPGPWVAAVGVAVALAGSGVGRWSDGTAQPGSGFGDIVAEAEVTWPLVVLGLVVTVVGIGWSVARRAGVRPVAACVGLLAHAVGLAILAATMGEVVVGQWVEGRPRRRHGRLVPMPAVLDDSPGARWAKAARDEAAAVVAFRDLADRLEHVGAPADLVAWSRVAAADEVRHARACRRLAVLHGATDPGVAADVAPPPTRARLRGVELVRLAVESHVDGVVGEGRAAERLERTAAELPTHGATLSAMARDERAHAALGADVVAWCTTQAPRSTGVAVRAAARRIDRQGVGFGPAE